jgi:hypothetical protein
VNILKLLHKHDWYEGLMFGKELDGTPIDGNLYRRCRKCDDEIILIWEGENKDKPKWIPVTTNKTLDIARKPVEYIPPPICNCCCKCCCA